MKYSAWLKNSFYSSIFPLSGKHTSLHSLYTAQLRSISTQSIKYIPDVTKSLVKGACKLPRKDHPDKKNLLYMLCNFSKSLKHSKSLTWYWITKVSGTAQWTFKSKNADSQGFSLPRRFQHWKELPTGLPKSTAVR